MMKGIYSKTFWILDNLLEGEFYLLCHSFQNKVVNDDEVAQCEQLNVVFR